ncbi:alpha/beta fold hydrolase [Aliikangiella maris]|uniref:Uncharacterized protein n=2 Tax=Aliikangiella maris TaxID=3162458 RepID=A0ABV3MNR7_9GAMM
MTTPNYSIKISQIKDMVQKLLKTLIILFTTLVSLQLVAKHQSQIIQINNHPLHVTRWFIEEQPSLEKRHTSTTEQKATVILLSGPTDNWFSDSAWYARLAPRLTKQFDVYTIDRAGQITADAKAQVGYVQFADDLRKFIIQKELQNIHFVGFASSNISLLHLFNQSAEFLEPMNILSVTLIDPDVITDFSIERYRKDAYPFKKNLQAYVKYIEEGKYDARAKQKTEMDYQHIKTLSADDPLTDWQFVERIFARRLNRINLQNQFREIAQYDEDLLSTKMLFFPKELKLTIIDTDFEQRYIEQSKNDELKKELKDWRKDGKQYYLKLIERAKEGKYIELDTQEHLIPFSQPEVITDILLEK